MRIEINPNYTVFMSPTDVASLIAGKKVSFWIVLDDHEDLTFELKKE